MKKQILIFLISFLLIFIGWIFVGKEKIINHNTTPTPLVSPLPSKAEIPNPAAVYCINKGGKIEIRKDKEGNEAGFCIFEDGSECEEWAFYYGKCKKSERFCKDLCGDGICQEIVCQAVGCPCPEDIITCPKDCTR